MDKDLASTDAPMYARVMYPEPPAYEYQMLGVLEEIRDELREINTGLKEVVNPPHAPATSQDHDKTKSSPGEEA